MTQGRRIGWACTQRSAGKQSRRSAGQTATRAQTRRHRMSRTAAGQCGRGSRQACRALVGIGRTPSPDGNRCRKAAQSALGAAGCFPADGAVRAVTEVAKNHVRIRRGIVRNPLRGLAAPPGKRLAAIARGGRCRAAEAPRGCRPCGSKGAACGLGLLSRRRAQPQAETRGVSSKGSHPTLFPGGRASARAGLRSRKPGGSSRQNRVLRSY